MEPCRQLACSGTMPFRRATRWRAWAKLAEICNEYLKKGKQVYIEGRLQTRTWEDQSGVKKYTTEVIAQNMVMLGRVGDSVDMPAQASPDDENIPQTAGAKDDDDLPF